MAGNRALSAHALDVTVRVLVAGIGNVFLGDDGFGVEVVRRLRTEALGDGVTVSDFGIRGVHLAYELAGGGYDAAVLVDAVSRGGAPGTLYGIEPDISPAAAGATVPDAHGLTPAAVLGWLARIGEKPPRLLVVGCEPASLDEGMTLSAPVAGALERAIQMVRETVARLLVDGPSCGRREPGGDVTCV